MGFIDDVEWVLTQTPPQRQIALFSATMPDAIRRIARRHLREPAEVTVETKTVTNAAIRQRVWMMAGVHKLDALTRMLEVEDFDAVIIFVRTRLATTELADKLAARGYTAAALNGDVPQKLREKTIDQLKAGALDILVATDVAARGLDVERISHVINYDIPYDVEAYVHRIGRTGRAGRSGEAILFAANRERRLLRAIEKATGQVIEKMELPSAEQVADKRAGRLWQQVTEALGSRDHAPMRDLLERYQREQGVPAIDIAAALGLLVQGSQGALLRQTTAAGKATATRNGVESGYRGADGERPSTAPRRADKPRPDKPARAEAETPARGMERYRIEVGHQHGVKPGNIVGAIANEADLDSQYIGHIRILDDHSTVDLPAGMPVALYRHLQGVWVSGRRLQLSRLEMPRAALVRKGGAKRVRTEKQSGQRASH
jgi:ATP-dependent RNA helicase DeaD